MNKKTSVKDPSGSWYAYNGEKIGQGREAAKRFLKENPSVMEEIETKVRAHFNKKEGGEGSETGAAGKTGNGSAPVAEG